MDTKEKIIEALEGTKEFNIKFRTENIDSEEIRECIEDSLGVEILEIEEIKWDLKTNKNVTSVANYLII